MKFISSDFKLFNKDKEYDNAVIFITADASINELTFTFTNNTDSDLQLVGGTPVESTKASAASTFLIDFTKILTVEEVKSIKVTTSNSDVEWETAVFVSEDPTIPPALGIAPKDKTTIKKDQTLEFTLTKFTCGTDIPDNFEVQYFNFTGVDSTNYPFIFPVSLLHPKSGTVLPVSITYSDVVHNIKQNLDQEVEFLADQPIPVAISYKNDYPIENGYTINFKNESKQALGGSAPSKTNATITLSFLLGEGDNAITTTDAAKDLAVNLIAPDKYPWEVVRGSDSQNFLITPKTDGMLGAGDTLQIKVSKLSVPSSFTPSKISSVRIQTNEISHYDDSLFSIQMEKKVAEPKIESFVVSPTTINYGENTKLSWKTTEAWRVVIHYELRNGTTKTLDSERNEITLSASDFTPPVPPTASVTRFILEIYGDSETPVKQEERSLNVKQPPVVIKSFEVSPRLINMHSPDHKAKASYTVDQAKSIKVDNTPVSVTDPSTVSSHDVTIDNSREVTLQAQGWDENSLIVVEQKMVLAYEEATPAGVGAIGDGNAFQCLPLSLTNEHKKRIYVSNSNTNCIYQIDQITKLPVSPSFTGNVMAMTLDGNYLLVADVAEGKPPTMNMYDTTSGASVGSAEIPGPGPYVMGCSPDGSMLVAGAHGEEMGVYYAAISGGTLGALQTVANTDGKGPRYIQFGSNNSVYIANYNSASISVYSIDSGALTFQCSVPTVVGDISCTQPRAMAMVGTNIFVACSGENYVLVFDTTTNTFTKAIAAGNRPFNLTLNKNNTRLFVANLGATTVSVIDTSSQELLKDLNVGNAPASTAINDNGSLLFVSNYCDKTLSIVDIDGDDLNVIPETLDLGAANGNPIDITTYDDKNGYTNVYVAKEYFVNRVESCSSAPTDTDLNVSILSIQRDFFS